MTSARSPAARTCVGHELGDHGVPRHEPQHGAAVTWRVVAARLVVARHAGPGGDRGQQRETRPRRRLHRLGDVGRPLRPEQGDRLRVAGRELCCPDGPRLAMGLVRDAGCAEHRVGHGGQLRRERGVHARHATTVSGCTIAAVAR